MRASRLATRITVLFPAERGSDIIGACGCTSVWKFGALENVALRKV